MSEAAPFLPPIDVANWGFWGVFGFTALLFFRPQDTIPALAPLHLPEVVAIAALIAMVRTASAGACRCCGFREKRLASG